MNISCTQCKTRYHLSEKDFKLLADKPFTCRSCHNTIRIIICPECRFLYTVSYPGTQAGTYTLRCRKCQASFRVELPAAGVEHKAPAPPAAPQNPVAEITARQAKQSPPPAAIMPSTAREKPQTKAETPPRAKNEPRSSILHQAQSAFTMKQVLPAMIGALGMIVITRIHSLLGTALLPSAGQPAIRAMAGFSGLVWLVLIILIWLTVSTSISTGIFSRRYHDSDRISPFQILKMAATMLFVTLSFSAAGFAIAAAFTAIPFVGPLLYGLLFLPLYLFSLVFIIGSTVGMLYYPPLLAHRRFDLRQAPSTIFAFMRNHVFALAVFTPLLLCVALTLLGSVFVLHHSALKIVMRLSENMLPEQTLATISAIPAGLMDLNNILFAGLDISRHETLVNNLLFSHHAGGMLIGLSLSLISVVLLGLAISIVSTLTTEAYLMINNDRLPGAAKVAAFSGAMAGILLCLLLLRSVVG